MLNKQKVLNLITYLPENFQLEYLVENLIILEKIEIGLQQIEDEKFLNTKEAREHLKKWLK